MAITWVVDSTAGLGPDYKDVVERTAEERDYGNLYYAKRIDDGDSHQHAWLTRTKKWLGLKKYEFVTYTHINEILNIELGSGWGPTVTEL